MKKVSCSRILFVLCFIGLFSCAEKDVTPACSTAWATELQGELDALANAAAAYNADPSSANCTDYRNAYLAYLKGLRSYTSCSLISGQSRKALDDAIKEAESEINSLCQ